MYNISFAVNGTAYELSTNLDSSQHHYQRFTALAEQVEQGVCGAIATVINNLTQFGEATELCTWQNGFIQLGTTANTIPTTLFNCFQSLNACQAPEQIDYVLRDTVIVGGTLLSAGLVGAIAYNHRQKLAGWAASCWQSFRAPRETGPTETSSLLSRMSYFRSRGDQPSPDMELNNVTAAAAAVAP